MASGSRSPVPAWPSSGGTAGPSGNPPSGWRTDTEATMGGDGLGERVLRAHWPSDLTLRGRAEDSEP